MKSSLLAVAMFMFTTAAYAELPQLDATCPGDIEVHADQDGPVYINGKEAVLKATNENYYEAKGGGVTISISVSQEGVLDVSYTGKNKVHGICTVDSD